MICIPLVIPRREVAHRKHIKEILLALREEKRDNDQKPIQENWHMAHSFIILCFKLKQLFFTIYLLFLPKPPNQAATFLDVTELTMVANSGPFKDAPPTRKPSISSCFASSAQLPPFTDPP